MTSQVEVSDGEQALRQTDKVEYDVVLLDLMIPRPDGLSVLKSLRIKGYKGAVLLVTCKGQERDKLQGLNNGADDYVVKPFLLSELIARVRAVLRRMHAAPVATGKGSILKTGDLQLDLLKREARKFGKVISLTKKEFELLECFLRRPGQVLSQTVLSQRLSNSEIQSQTNFIEVHVKNLRTKIDAKTGPSLIRTVRGCGYALEA